MRAYCHCTICQQFNNGPYADVSIYRAQAVRLPEPESLEYKTYRPPPAVQRGACKSCGSPAVEVMQITALPKLVIVPTMNVPDACVIDPVMHMFYNRRVAAVADDLPKYSGYLQSQLGFGRKLLLAMLNTRTPAH